MIPRLALLAFFAAAPAAAGEALTAEAFERMAEGRVLHFTLQGQPFGAEQYFRGRRSLWQYADGSCAEGVWWPEGGGICFRYGERTDTQCWRFEARRGGFAAELVEGGAPTGFVLELSRQGEAPLACPGPRVGS